MRHHERHGSGRRWGAIAAVLLGLALLVAACGGATDDAPAADDGGDQPTSGDPDDDAGGDPDDGEAADGDDAPGDLREFTELAVEAAASEWDVDEDDIEVVRSEEVEWPDGARGCPAEGEAYSQAVVPGYRVVLDVAGERAHYHGGEGEPPFHCEDPDEPVDA